MTLLDLRAGPLLDAEIDVLGHIAAGSDRRLALLVGDDVEVVEPGRRAEAAQNAALTAGELRNRRREPRHLQRGKLAYSLLEDQTRQDLVLRQLGNGAERHLRVRGAARKR